MFNRLKICFTMFLLITLGMGFSVRTVQAQTFEFHFPTYEIYCKDTEVIKSGTVYFELKDPDKVAQGEGLKRSQYQVVTNENETEFAIPFLSSAREIPNIVLNVNNQIIEYEVWYGDNSYFLEADTNLESQIEKTYSPELDNSLIGTHYTIIPDSDSFTINLSFNEFKGMIYDTTSNQSAMYSDNGIYNWTFNNALYKQSYEFFIVGEQTDYSFICSCEYQSEVITCKDFISKGYAIWKEYYDANGGVSVNLFYSIMNSLLHNNLLISYEELFFDSIDTYRLNAFRFNLPPETQAIISYDLPIKVQRNNMFEIMIYMVEQKKVGSYQTKYLIELNTDYPYIIESNIQTERNGTLYTAESVDDFYFVFSASEKPSGGIERNNANLIIGIVCACAGVVAIIFIIVCIINCRKLINKK